MTNSCDVSRHYLECMVRRVKWLQTVPPPGPSAEDDGALVIDKMIVAAGWSPALEANTVHLASLQTPVADLNSLNGSSSLRQLSLHRHSGKVTDIAVVPNPRHGDATGVVLGSDRGHVTWLRVHVPECCGDAMQGLRVECNGAPAPSAEGGSPPCALPTLSSGPLHRGAVTGLDVNPDTLDLVSVGEDGAICQVSPMALKSQEHAALKPADGSSFAGVKWMSYSTFATVGTRSGIETWDTRQSGQAGAAWRGAHRTGAGREGREAAAGGVLCLDVLRSRPHILAVGDYHGTLSIWDLRKQDQSVQGSVAASAEAAPLWEVRFDHFERFGASAATTSAPPGAALPNVLACCEDGHISVSSSKGSHMDGGMHMGLGMHGTKALGGDKMSWSIHQEPSAINTFDIDMATGQDVVFCSDGECLGFLHQICH